MSKNPNYQIYPSLIDKFESYINSSRIYNEYYGFSELPTITEDEFEKRQFESLINTINRVPFESEAADKGTMFNEVIDCIVENRKSEKMRIEILSDEVTEIKHKGTKSISVFWKERNFTFNIEDCKTIAKALKGAVCQNLIEGFIETKYGVVKLYGYYDYLLPFRLIDLKTTSKYSAFKYRNNWQHIVYPFILNTNGITIKDFTYLVYKWNKEGGEIFEEDYVFDFKKDTMKLKNVIELFIEFLELNKEFINDKKIFNSV